MIVLTIISDGVPHCQEQFLFNTSLRGLEDPGAGLPRIRRGLGQYHVRACFPHRAQGFEDCFSLISSETEQGEDIGTKAISTLESSCNCVMCCLSSDMRCLHSSFLHVAWRLS